MSDEYSDIPGDFMPSDAERSTSEGGCFAKDEQWKAERRTFFEAGANAVEFAVQRRFERDSLRWLMGMIFRRNMFLYSTTVFEAPIEEFKKLFPEPWHPTFCGIPFDVISGEQIDRYGRYSARLYSTNGAKTIAILETSDTISLPPEIFFTARPND